MTSPSPSRSPPSITPRSWPGKNAEFRCHVHEIRTHDSYQLDDTFAKEIGQCENMEQMRENMGKALQDYYNQRAEQELRWQLMHQAAATVEEQPIDEELDRMVEAQMETLTAQLAQKGLTLEAYCQFTGSDEKKLPGGYAARRAGGFPHPEGGGKDCPAGEPDRHRRGDGRRHPAHLR